MHFFALFVVCFCFAACSAKGGKKGSSSSSSRTGCSPPEVIFNGTVFSMGREEDFGTVQEIHFMGMLGPLDRKRSCKIKCIDGVWTGPLCTADNQAGDGGRFHPVLKQCVLRRPDDGVEIFYDGRLLNMTQAVELPHDSLLHFRCVKIGLYKFSGNSTLRCMNGQWSAPLPTCLETSQQKNMSVSSPPTISYTIEKGNYGITETGDLVVYPQSIVKFFCVYPRHTGTPQWSWTSQRDYSTGWTTLSEDGTQNYELLVYYSKEQDTGQYTCSTPQGQSNEISLIVNDVNCPPIEGDGDENRVMRKDGTNLMHSKARFSCMEGYNLVGSSEIVCTPSGKWSDRAPLCVVIECPMVPTGGHLRVSTFNRTYGVRVHFSCPPAYKLIGPEFVTCLKNETWSDTPPVCEPIRCRPPLPPENGRVLDNGRYLPSDVVQYTCNAGYVLIGDSFSECNINGTWSKPMPRCKPACEFPGKPAYGRIIPTKFHYDIEEVVSVACNPGFRLLGAHKIHCSRDGHWSSPLPHCRPLPA